MQRKKKCLTIPVVVSCAAWLLCLTAGFGVISAAEPQFGKEISESGSAESQTSDAEETPVIGPRTDKLLRAMGDYLKTAKQFTFHTENTYDDLLPSGQKIQYSASNWRLYKSI